MIALYSGLRVNEISQLYVDDIEKCDGVWCFHVRMERPGQRLKNRHSERRVPIHERILDAGFLTYVEDARRWNSPVLFPSIKWGANGPGDAVTDWFCRLMRGKLNEQGYGATFHAFRHNFAERMREARLEEMLIAEMLGHDTTGTVLRRHYFQPARPQVMNTALHAAVYPPLLHTPYKRGRFDRVFAAAASDASRHARLDGVFSRNHGRAGHE
jgi:integrase